MSTSHVPGDVWRIIIKHFHKPVPSPLSKPPRSEIRQQNLTILARFCGMFYDIIIPLPYHTVITDNLPRLLELKIHKRRVKLLKEYTKHLYIEYSCKRQYDPTYTELFDRRDMKAWGNCGRTEADKVVHKQEACRMELEELREYFAGYKDPATGRIIPRIPISVQAFIPKLESIAVSSIYGQEPDTWELFDSSRIHRRNKGYVDPPSPLLHCAERFLLFVQVGDVRHLCIRDLHGPLSIPEIKGVVDTVPHTTMHFDLADIPRLSLRLGSASRWAYDGSMSEDWKPILSALGHRLHILRILRSGLIKPAGPPNLLISCSTSLTSCTTFDARSALNYRSHLSPSENGALRELSYSEQSSMARELQKVALSMTRRADPRNPDSLYSGDSVLWSASPDTPVCEACKPRAS